MGLLDTRLPPTYYKWLEKITPVDFGLMKLLSVKKIHTVREKPPKYAFYVFSNHLMSQQGIPAGLKVVGLFCVIYIPGLALYWAFSKRHPFRQEF